MLVPSPAYLKGISIFGPGVNISFLPGLAVLVVECGVHLRVGVSEDVKRMVLVLKMILLLQGGKPVYEVDETRECMAQVKKHPCHLTRL